MTPADVLDQLLLVNQRLCAGEITESEADDEQQGIILKARLLMTDQEFIESQAQVLLTHHRLAERLVGTGYDISGNDPTKPN